MNTHSHAKIIKFVKKSAASPTVGDVFGSDMAGDLADMPYTASTEQVVKVTKAVAAQKARDELLHCHPTASVVIEKANAFANWWWSDALTNANNTDLEDSDKTMKKAVFKAARNSYEAVAYKLTTGHDLPPARDGYNANLAHKVLDYARRVDRGEAHDPSFLPILFETPNDADWEDEAVWHACNPGLAHGYPDLEGLRQLAREARERPADREAFKQLHLNMWADHSHAPFVEMALYDAGAEPFDLEEMAHQPCWLGVDVSSNSDLTAVVACWRDPDKENGYRVWPWFFCPEDNLDKRTQQSGYPYSEWAETGAILPTPGNVIDIRMVEDHIRDLCEKFEVREIAADPHYAKIMLANLIEDGYPAIQFRQGWMSMGPAIHELEKAILSGGFRHGGHPVLRWNFDNVTIQDDGKGNRSFNKSKARDKIDGAVAAAMAVARAATGEDTRSIYDSEERADGLLVW